MVKKLFLAALLVFVSGIFITGCSSNPESNSSGVVGQSQVGQESGSQGTTADSANDTANMADRYVRLDNGEGGVQVEAIWITPEYLKATGEDDLVKKYDLSKNVIIEITMTAHMGDLTQYPILNNASLTVSSN